MAERNVNASIPAQTFQVLVGIPDDPDNFHRFFVDASNEHSLAQRVRPRRVGWPKEPRQILIDDSNSLRPLTIMLRECSAPPQRNLKHREVIRRYDENACDGSLAQQQPRLISSLDRCSREGHHR